ncbi:phage regulatory CII family protein [Desulfovibrio desulfuricans]|uniref:phage regulatory CII family protein n=1 Tax=Desulfovibrio desulfuricans TaxID=876 RepID=UPI003983E7A1
MEKSMLVTICKSMAQNAPNRLNFETIAKLVGKEYPTLASELSQQPGHKLGAETMLQLMLTTDGREPIHYMARELGGAFVEFPLTGNSLHCLTRGMAECVKEFGEFIVSVAKSLEDGTISSEELTRIGKEGQEALTAILKVMELAKRAGA